MNLKFDSSHLSKIARKPVQKEESSSDSENLDLIGHLNLNEPEFQVKKRSQTFYSQSSQESEVTNMSGYPQLNMSLSGSSLGKDDNYKTAPNFFHQQFQFKKKIDIPFLIQLDYILTDGRTTLMIKNIPNKYTQPLLIDKIDKKHKGNYDFFYLPIDFTNKCNVGYAFINFTTPQKIAAFYIEFHDKKWDMFNSDKVCQITYARIQGCVQLQAHFQYSTIMKEKDRKLKPVFMKQFDQIRRKKQNF